MRILEHFLRISLKKLLHDLINPTASLLESGIWYFLYLYGVQQLDLLHSIALRNVVVGIYSEENWVWGLIGQWRDPTLTLLGEACEFCRVEMPDGGHEKCRLAFRHRGSHCSRWALATYQDPMTGIIRIIWPAFMEHVCTWGIHLSIIPISRSLILIFFSRRSQQGSSEVYSWLCRTDFNFLWP